MQTPCECGCGELAPLATATNKESGTVLGQPQRFISGHNSRVDHPAQRPLAERFWEKVNKNGALPDARSVRIHPEIENTNCWEWTGAVNPRGYGITTVEGSTVSTHRAAWFLKTGQFPNLCALHKCDNRKCVRFSHLFEGSKQTNSDDKYAKGRANHPTGNQTTAKLTATEVTEIRTALSKGDMQCEVALEYNVSRATICDIVHGRTWNNNAALPQEKYTLCLS